MTEESIRELFNQTVPQFIKTSTIHDLCSTQIGSAICRKGWITNDDSIMDFGCGVGSFSMTLYEQIRFASCLGVDSSDNMIVWFDKFKHDKGLDSVFHSECAFIDSPDMLDGKKFDVIISLKAFHHIPDPLPMIQILKSYLKPNGRLIIADLYLDDHSPVYHRSIKEPPCCHGFSCDEMTGFLTDAGLHAEVDKVDVVHYLSCLDQEEAKHRYEDLHIVPCDIVHTNPKALPAMYKIGDTYYERDVFPFILACGQITTIH
ncbi:hypothetical protein WA171_002905 [Blastocystis sp. BT1]